jgi:hypothetical protein
MVPGREPWAVDRVALDAVAHGGTWLRPPPPPSSDTDSLLGASFDVVSLHDVPAGVETAEDELMRRRVSYSRELEKLEAEAGNDPSSSLLAGLPHSASLGFLLDRM